MVAELSGFMPDGGWIKESARSHLFEKMVSAFGQGI